MDRVGGVVTELRFDKLVVRPAILGDGFSAHNLANALARFRARWGNDVDALEEIAVAGEELHTRLGRTAAKREGGLNAFLGWDADDVANTPVAVQVLLVKVEHGDVQAKDAGL